MHPESGEPTGCSTACPLMRSKGACVFPSRPRPTRRSTGRIHISDFRQHRLTCEPQPVHTCPFILKDLAETLGARAPPGRVHATRSNTERPFPFNSLCEFDQCVFT